MKRTNLNKEQQTRWQRMLSNALIKQRKKFSLSYLDKVVLAWHERYTALMNQKADILAIKDS